MKKILSIFLMMFIFVINVNARINVSYDDAVKESQSYIYKFNNYGKYLITESKYRELRGSSSAIIPFGYTDSVEVNESFKRGGLLSQKEFEISKNSSGSTYLIQDSDFFLIGKKAVDILENKVIDAGDKKYGTRVTEYVIPGTKVKGSGTKVDPWVFVGSYKLSFYISNGKITNNGQKVNRYTVYALESNEGQIIINFEPSDGFEYQSNNCDFTYEYDNINKIHRIYKDNKDISNDEECTIKLKSNKLLVEYDYNGGTGSCESLAVSYGSKINNLCTSVSKEGYTFSGWKDESGNTITNDTVINNNIKVYAQWTVKQSTLTINPNGGVWNNKSETQTITQAYNTTTTINNPSKGAVYTVTFDANNQGATISKTSIGAERAFNSWEFLISGGDTTSKFENNTFTFGSEDVKVSANYNTTSNSISLATINKTGYSCKWNTASDGTGTSYSSGYSGYTTTSNVKLYAICTSNLYKVTFNNQGATDSGTTSTNVTYGSTISNIKIPSKIYKVTFVNGTSSSASNVSYTFGGYYTSTNGGGTQYVNANGGGSRAYNLTSNTTLYAKWTGGSITLPSTSKTGYTFNGWYTSSSGGTKVGGSNSTYYPTSNITLYAQYSENATTNYTLTINPNGGIWNGTYSSSTFTGSVGNTKTISNPTAQSYTVSFNTNGGTSVSSKTASSSFKSWSLSGAGTLSGTTFTYGSGNSVLIAYYNVNSITLPSTSKTGYTFNGWYTSSSGGTRVGGSNSSYTPSSNTTLYAQWTANTSTTSSYYINYNLNNGSHGSYHPTSATYDSVVNISNPTKTVTVNLSNGSTSSGATISKTSASAAQTFAGWTASNLNTSTARYGSSSSSVTTQWSSGSTKVKSTYFKNLTSTNNATVTLTANWTQKNITLPTITKSGYECGWSTSSSSSAITYASGSTYVPSASGSSSINLYGVCKSVSAPSLKVTFTTSAGYSDYCSDTYTASNNGCTFSSSYYAPITLKMEATDTNTVSSMKFEYNSSGQSSYTEVNSSENVSITKSGNTYTATRTISSTGKRKFKVTATNNVGKSSVVIIYMNIIEQSFASQYSCTSTALTSGTIYSWKAGSTCTTVESDTTKCSEVSGSEYFGIINSNQTICVKDLNWLSSNTVRVNAYVPQSAFYIMNGQAYKKGNYSSVTYNNVKYYYVTMPVWCNASSCNYGWVINSAAQEKICPSIKTKNTTLYNKIC